MNVVIAAIALLNLTACVTLGSAEWFEASENGKTALVDKAAFELGCPKAELKIVPVPRGSYRVAFVAGCGKEKTYYFDRGQWVRAGEVLL